MSIPRTPSGVDVDGSSAAWRAIALVRDAWAIAGTSADEAAALWLAASDEMDRASGLAGDPTVAAAYLRAAASLAVHARQPALAAELDQRARSTAPSGQITAQTGQPLPSRSAT